MTSFPISEGFDNYASPAAVAKRIGDLTWIAAGSGLTPGVYGGQALIIGWGSPAYAELAIVADPIYLGLRMNLTLVNQGGKDFAYIACGTYSGGTFHPAYTITLNPTIGAFQLLDHLGNAQWTSANSLFGSHTWFYLEIKASTGAGTLTFYVNGVLAATATGVTLASDAVFSFSFQPFAIGEYFYIDDMYWSTSGLLGDCRAVSDFPTANSSAAWHSVSGNANYLNVSSITPTSENSSSTPGQTDLFVVGNFPSGTVQGASVKLSSYTDTIASSGMVIELSSSGTVAASGTIVNGTISAVTTLAVNTDPATSAAWTTSGLNAALAGYEEVG